MKHESMSDEEIKDLAVKLCNLEYTSLARFLDAMSVKLNIDSIEDANRHRNQLSSYLLLASQNIRKAWGICRYHMKNE